MDQIFTGENKKQAEFFTFFEIYVFSRWNFSWSVGQFFGSSIYHIPYKKLRSCPWLVYICFCIKGYDYVERFVHVFVLLVINTGCPKKLLKMGNTALLISSSNYAKTPHKCMRRRLFVFPDF